MVITWYGGLCLNVEERMRGEDPRSAVFFPSQKTSRARTLEEKANVLIEGGKSAASKSSVYTIHTAGEYDIAGFGVRGVEIQGEKEKLVAYIIESNDLALCHMGGFLSETPKDREIETIGVVDILVVSFPEGARAATVASVLNKIVHEIEPRIVLPLVADTKMQTAVAKELGSEGERMTKLTIARKDLSEEGFRIIFLDPQ